jgi:hypothetical protein
MWWLDVIIVALFAAAVYGFVLLVRSQTRSMSRKTTRTAEDMYDDYADSPRQQHRFAQQHGGEWRDDPGARR